MSLQESVEYQCPYCWENNILVVDCSESEQEMVEDCQVCCQPILLNVLVDDAGIPSIEAKQENA